MSDELLEPLAADVRAVLNAGAAGSGPDAEVRMRLGARIAATTGVALATGAVHGGRTASAARAAKLGMIAAKPMTSVAIAFVLGAAVGVGAHTAWRGGSGESARASTQGAALPIAAPAQRSSSPAEPPNPPPARADQSLQPVRRGAPPLPSEPVAPTRPPASVPGRPKPPAGGSELSAENALVARARAALARGDADGALVAIAEHERRYPQGALLEEREVVRVQALVAAGRLEEAHTMGQRFHERFPHSLFGQVIDQVLAP